MTICNPRAQVHQQRAATIQQWMELNNYIPNPQEEAFVLWMLQEKEDRQAFTEHVRVMRVREQQR
jgi:hypothetical protein